MNAPEFPAALRVAGLAKTFILHNQGGAELAVLGGVGFEVRPGECVALDGPSGAGKSTLLKLIYANYRASAGSIRVRHDGREVELTAASPRELLELRRDTIGYVSQFLRVIPRVPAIDIVAESLLDDAGADKDRVREARREAQDLLLRLRIPQRLWYVPPATFSGGEQQRVNIARSLIKPWSLLLLDEPTASLDADNRITVISLINEARANGAAVVGIFHDAKVREAVATRVLDMAQFPVNGELVFKSARLVLDGEVVQGTLAVAGGNIVAVDAGGTSVPEAADLEGDYLLPGLVELHTDNFERHLMPRPKVRWPALPALLAHDAEVAAAGITTVFDALGVGDSDEDALRGQGWGEVIHCIDRASQAGLLRADHLLHVRCELPAPNTIELFAPFVGDPRVGLISLMDHTPGQRQWENLQQAHTYYTGKKGWSDAKFSRQVESSKVLQARYTAPHRAYFVEYAGKHGIALASHDDTKPAHVIEAHREGAAISEFPTSVEAASCAHGLGMSIVMGAPNVVRGGSHSGNVAALDLARLGLLDTLSSDYVPVSLLMGAFRLVDLAGFSIPKAVATISRNPAAAAGLTDRGEIAPGKRADLVQVRMVEGPEDCRQPVVRAVWRQGRRVV